MELMSVRNFGNWVEQIDSYAKQGPRAEGAGARVGAWEPWTRSRRRLDGRVHFHEPANERAGRARGRIGHSVISTSAAPGQQPPGIFCIVRCTLYVVLECKVMREKAEKGQPHIGQSLPQDRVSEVPRCGRASIRRYHAGEMVRIVNSRGHFARSSAAAAVGLTQSDCIVAGISQFPAYHSQGRRNPRSSRYSAK
jgi:hypothetical protein